MKELSIEQKAQAYDEAISKMKEIITMDNTPTTPREIGEYLFSELKESEDDRIRNFISNELACLRATEGKGSDRYEELTNAIAWLEKQGEQKITDKYNIRGIKSKHAEGKLGEMIKEMKSADKVEPKFHEGEWIIRSAEGFKHNTYLVKEVKDYYTCEDLKGQRVTFTLNDVHKNFKLWDISDAKPGDVLAVESENDYPSPFIAIYKERGLDYFNSHCFISFDAKFYTGDTGHDMTGIHPATKEQRDALEKAMADSGYTFDFEKKELKKIEQKSVDKVEPKFKIGDTIKDPYGDTYHIIEIENDSYKSDDGRFILFTNEKFYTLFNPAWSEEDEMFVHGLIRGLAAKRDIHGHTTFSSDCIDITETIDWLKSLKDRVQPKQEWSEEDEKTLDSILSCIEHCRTEDIESQYNGNRNIDLKRYEPMSNWLKSLRPQNTWKPSDEQMKTK